MSSELGRSALTKQPSGGRIPAEVDVVDNLRRLAETPAGCQSSRPQTGVFPKMALGSGILPPQTRRKRIDLHGDVESELLRGLNLRVLNELQTPTVAMPKSGRMRNVNASTPGPLAQLVRASAF